MKDFNYLKKAIDLSKLAPGGKNFRVGAMIVKNNKIISQGHSWEFGKGTHAEENAFSKINKGGSKGATLYCSMAPCTNRSSGKESCLERAHKQGIKRIVYACIAPDENPKNLLNSPIELIHIKDLEKTAQEVNTHLNRE